MSRCRILALPKYDTMAASMRQRLGQYVSHLQAAGCDVDIVPFFDNAYIGMLNRREKAGAGTIARAYVRRLSALRRAGDFDLIWLAYETFPYLPSFAERLVFAAGKPVVLDFDDAIFHQYDDHRLALARHLLGGKLQPLMAGATICAAGNAYLADYAKRFCGDVRILPTVVDTSRYAPVEGRTAGGPVTIGWIGTPSTWRYVEPLVPALQALASRPDVAVRIVGAGRLASPPVGIEFVDWSEEREIADIQSMDIGIMPVPDEPWSRGKCGYKLIQYGACDLPVVASPVGVNAEIVEEGVNGFYATTPTDFAAALERLIGDPALRDCMGQAGRVRVEERYSLAVHAPRFVQIVQDALAKGRNAGNAEPQRMVSGYQVPKVRPTGHCGRECR